MEITLEAIPKIEKALGIKLYESQIEALINNNNTLFVGRRCGRTITYMIKLALSEGVALNMEEFRYYSDRDSKETNYTDWFRHEFMNVRDILRDNEFDVRQVYCGDKFL